MDVEQIRFVKTMKVGEGVWKKGDILNAPFPAPVAIEIKAHLTKPWKYDTIEILKRKKPVAPVQSKPVEQEVKKPEVIEQPTPSKVKVPKRRVRK